MDIEELRTFVEIADAGGISPAALRLGVSKSIVSRRLLRLETELGVQLLSRSTRGAALTEAGATFRGHALRACVEIDIAREATQPTEHLRGRLRIAAPYSLGPTHIAPALAEMARRHPQLQIHASYSDHVVDLIGEGFDCAIRLGVLPDSNLVARRIGSVRGTLVASPAYIAARGAPETPGELLVHEALMKGTECWQFVDGGQPVAIRPQGRFKADSGAALVAAALAGLGIACLPDCLVRAQIDAGALVPLMPRYPVAPAGAYVVHSMGRHPPSKIRVLADLLAEYLGQAPAGAGMAKSAAELVVERCYR
ncbi:LysR family transcriptional regulator [Telluria beijingensis]|uniref:LysR family transcriptional regulator n=1 Tax=Telluria beijingensis TaxID=3068633 RepID=UPI002795E72B|nr:LysR family transcriptional regulator [Massilia sp. REN29]